MKNPLFQSATVRLTAWYMAILIVLSLLFSLIVYSIASQEFARTVGPRRPGETPLFIESDIVNQLRQERVEESNRHLIGNLLLFNIFTLGLGGAASYLLARRTLQPIEDALDAQSRFSSDAAHELRTPLTIMQSEIEVELRDKKSNKTSHQAVLTSNLEEVQRLRTMTDRLLLLASNHDLPFEPVELDDAAVEAVNRLIPIAQAKGISIENAVGTVTVRANRESVVDVLTVLLDNAIKYSPDKSEITVTSQVKDRQVLLAVSDYGPGLSDEEKAHVFDRFYRADSARSAQYVEGHGLGLSIAQRLMELMNGTIAVADNKHKGATFTVTFSLEPASQQAI
jgi:two-component system sensor histidine kinase CiaH